MKKFIKLLEQIYLNRRPAGANIVCREEDVMIVSYPKSGNTWLRCILANLLSDQEVTLNDMDKIVPDIYKATHGMLNKMPDIRYVKSHESFCADYQKVIYILRDPCDVLVSTYYYCLKTKRITEEVSLEVFVDQFLAGDYFSAFGTWQEHIGSWHGARGDSDNTLFLRYEDIIADQFNYTKKICQFLNLNKTDKKITLAIEASSMGSMRKLEQNGSWQSEKGDQREDIPFVRQGKSGHAKELLSKSSLEKIENAWGEWMKKFDYL